MSRAERRRAEKERNKKPAKYTFTEDELKRKVEVMVKAEMDKEKEEITRQAINQAMLLLFVLPMEVLMDFYWKKSYAKKNTRIYQSFTRLLRKMAKWGIRYG